MRCGTCSAIIVTTRTKRSRRTGTIPARRRATFGLYRARTRRWSGRGRGCFELAGVERRPKKREIGRDDNRTVRDGSLPRWPCSRVQCRRLDRSARARSLARRGVISPAIGGVTGGGVFGQPLLPALHIRRSRLLGGEHSPPPTHPQ